ncbi:MAG: hypothetical protein LBJ73_03440 [Rickettsiales bacterium]|nr:hypothetical protein [Rickettsiales bacterium]
MNRIIFRLSRVLACTVVIALFAHGSALAEIASKSYVDSLAMPNGDDYLLKDGGTMTGEIAMGGSKITGLGTPTGGTDAVTKKYVDDIAAQSAGGLNGNSPSWATLRDADWVSVNWGDTWEAATSDNSIKVEGVAACLGGGNNNDAVSESVSALVSGKPRWNDWGRNCYCRVSRVNDERVVGAWVFSNTDSTIADCGSRCAVDCGLCIRDGTNHSCTRAKLFAAP